MAIDCLYAPFKHWSENGTLWMISDTHFDDKELRTNQKNRPTDEQIIRNINGKVGKNDHLIILGDVGNIECVKRLRGHKILVCGNHDVGYSKYVDVFEEVYSGPVMIAEKIILSHEPIPNLTWAINLHGHNHSGRYNQDANHFNFCAEAINFIPVNMHHWFKEGHLSKIETLHRTIINNATKRKNKKEK